MTMDNLEYALNSVAWLIGGYTLRIIVERLRLWWYLRKEGVAPQVGTGALFGTIFVLLSVIQFLLIYGGRLHTDQIQACQDDINRNNVTAYNQRNALQTRLNAKNNAFIQTKAVYDAQFQHLILHPLDPADKLAVKNATDHLSHALAKVLVAESEANTAFLAAKAYVQGHPAVPTTVCTGDVPKISPVPTPTLSPTPSR